MLTLQHKHIELLYFVAVLLVAYAIKDWYSQVALAEMQWMMKPLAKVLEQFIPGSFEVDEKGQWYNTSWHIILVKACSGLNFFIASFVVLAIAFNAKLQRLSVGKFIGLIVAALLLAWPITLFANTVRILTAMYFIHHPEILQWTQLNGEQIHRLVGLLVYFPLLVLQLQVVQACSLLASYTVCAIILLSLLVVVPILTGNAFYHLAAFTEHIITVFSVLGIFGVLFIAINLFKNKLSFCK